MTSQIQGLQKIFLHNKLASGHEWRAMKPNRTIPAIYDPINSDDRVATARTDGMPSQKPPPCLWNADAIKYTEMVEFNLFTLPLFEKQLDKAVKSTAEGLLQTTAYPVVYLLAIPAIPDDTAHGERREMQTRPIDKQANYFKKLV